jgi:hypothetical protein
VEAGLRSVVGWQGLNNPWVPDVRESDYVYVDLQRNQEKYTGGWLDG